MNWLGLLVDLIAWATPVALLVVAVGSHDLQRLVLPVVAGLILLLTVAAAVRFWPQNSRI